MSFQDSIARIMMNKPSTYEEMVSHPSWSEAASYVDKTVLEQAIENEERFIPLTFPPSINVLRRERPKNLERFFEKTTRSCFKAISDFSAFRVNISGSPLGIQEEIKKIAGKIAAFVKMHGGLVYDRPPYIENGVIKPDIIGMIHVYFPHLGFAEVQIGHEFAFTEYERESMFRDLDRRQEKWPHKWRGIFWETFINYENKPERLYALIERKILHPELKIDVIALLKAAYAQEMGVDNVINMNPEVVSPKMIHILKSVAL